MTPLVVAVLALAAAPDAQVLKGELESVDFVRRTGRFRTAAGEVSDFTLTPTAVVRHAGAEADLRHLPVPGEAEFTLTADADGRFTRATAVRSLAPADQAATEKQREAFAALTKARGVPARVERTGGRTFSVTLLGDPDALAPWAKEFAAGKDVQVCVANDELRTWNPPVDKERARIDESNGTRLTLTVTNMLEGFRRGRYVRLFAPGWPIKDPPYGESLMGYGFERLRAAEYVELTPKEYPSQFPFRTDHGNRGLPWFQVTPGEPPPPFAEHLVLGELASVAGDGKSGRFRTDRTGAPADFTLLPTAAVKYLGADAKLSDVPVGTRLRFGLFQDEAEKFTRAGFVLDEFTHMAAGGLTWAVEAVDPTAGRVVVARLLPKVKNYNGDYEQPPAVGRRLLRVTPGTRIRKGDATLSLADLAAGDVLLANVTADLPGKPSRCTDVWVGADTHAELTRSRAAKAAPPKKK